jgi:hypothetical protein
MEPLLAAKSKTMIPVPKQAGQTNMTQAQAVKALLRIANIKR